MILGLCHDPTFCVQPANLLKCWGWPSITLKKQVIQGLLVSAGQWRKECASSATNWLQPTQSMLSLSWPVGIGGKDPGRWNPVSCVTSARQRFRR